MSEKYIDVIVDDNGKVTIEAHGFTGGACLKETAALEKALGKVTKRSMKAEAQTAKVADKAIIGKG